MCMVNHVSCMLRRDALATLRFREVDEDFEIIDGNMDTAGVIRLQCAVELGLQTLQKPLIADMPISAA